MTIEASAAPIVPLVTDPPAAPATPAAQPAAPVVQPAAPVAASAPAEVKLTSEQLKQRLADERRAAERQTLSRYGVEKPEDLDAKLKKLADFEASQLTDKERTEKQLAELTKKATRAETLEAALSLAVQEQFDALPERTRAAIDSLNPSSIEDRLKYIRAFRSVTPLPEQGQPPPPPAPQPPAPPPAPANTAPVQPAPKPGGKTKYQEYEDLKARNHVAAGLFYQANRPAIEASRPQA